MEAAIVGAADVNVNARGVGTFGLGMLMFGRLASAAPNGAVALCRRSVDRQLMRPIVRVNAAAARDR
jgi:hypothetical protein